MAEGNRLPSLENAPHLKTDGEFFLPLRLSCKERLFSKTYPSFLTVKEGSTSHPGPLSSGEREETALLGARNRYAIRLADHQRSSPCCGGWDRRGTTCYNLLVETTIFVPHCSIALHLSPLEWGILFLYYFWEDYLRGGSHQGYGRNLMTAIGHMFPNGTEEQCSIC